MKYIDLEALAKEGRLTVSKFLHRESTRRIMIWSKEPDILDQRIVDEKIIPYKIFSYQARTDNMEKHQFYKITRGDFRMLLEAGAKVGEIHV